VTRFTPFLSAYRSENAKGKTKHITALEGNYDSYTSIRGTIQYTVYVLLPNDIYCCHHHVILNVTYVTHYEKRHLKKTSQVLKSTLQKQNNGRLLEGTTKSPYVNRHGIFLTIIMNVNVVLISSFNGQCQHKNSRCGNGYAFSCHSILSVLKLTVREPVRCYATVGQ
jgi:hypothetical protein